MAQKLSYPKSLGANVRAAVIAKSFGRQKMLTGARLGTDGLAYTNMAKCNLFWEMCYNLLDMRISSCSQ